uniref:Uncharacterized protein n=1 Tax=Triticum urartu TaxID=4572 RepID=A0A8R7R9I1_TRIUA
MVLVLCEKFGHLNLTFSIGEQISSNGVILIAMTSMAPRGGKAARRVLPCWVERRPEHVTDMCWVAGRFLALLTVHQRIMGKNGLKKDDVGDLKIIFGCWKIKNLHGKTSANTFSNKETKLTTPSSQ